MSSNSILEIFGRNVQKYRKEQRLSQEKLAEYAGLHRTYIGMIERAEKNITLVNIEKIAKALNIICTKVAIIGEIWKSRAKLLRNRLFEKIASVTG